MTPVRQNVFNEIDAERDYQDGKWGKEFDSKNTVNDWAAYINIYLSKATAMNVPASDVRKNMMKVAALAVAALERYDENDGFAPRHYDAI